MASWYEEVKHGKQLLQGEIICSCKVIKPILAGDTASAFQDHEELPENLGDSEIEIEGEMTSSNIVILSQSCDLDPDNPPDFVVACPVYALHDHAKSIEDHTMGNYSNVKNLIEETMPEWHLLDQCPVDTLNKDYLIVDFRKVYPIPFDSVRADAEKAETRWCLKPPFRERLSQAFARLFMRVALDDPIKIGEDDWIREILRGVLKESYENAQRQYQEFTEFTLSRDPQSNNWQIKGSYTEIEGWAQTVLRHGFIIETTKDRGPKEAGKTKNRFEAWIGKLRRAGYESDFAEPEGHWIGHKTNGEYASRVAVNKVEPYTPCDDYSWFPATNLHHIIIDYIEES
jgi:hypothetical protein